MVNEIMLFSVFTGLAILFGVALAWLAPLGRRGMCFLLGMSMSIMLVLTFFMLLPAAWAYGDLSDIGFGLLFALLLIWLLHQEGFCRVKEGSSEWTRLGLCFFLVILLHHAPEGAAMGISLGTEYRLGLWMALGLILHNIPEGFSLAAPLLAAGHSPKVILGLALISSLVFPLSTWLGILITANPDWMSRLIMLAATMMGWMIWETAPELLKEDARYSLFGAGTGVILMYIVGQIH